MTAIEGKPPRDRRRRSRSCPTCGKPSAEPTYPFCSDRCRDRDLHRWLSGSYAIPVLGEDGVREEDDI